MSEYLSIGEVVKSKGVSHRMLRYYDKIGVLKPIYINHETGYRYYSTSQMVILDLILMCTDLGIPLKKFNEYAKDGMFDIDKIIADGNTLAMKKIKHIKKTMYMLNSLKNHIHEINRPYNTTYEKYIDARYFLTKEVVEISYDISKYWEQLYMVYTELKNLDLTLSVNQGMCAIYNDRTYKYFTFIEVAKPKRKIENVMQITGGTYKCEKFYEKDFVKAEEKYLKLYPDGSILIFKDVFQNNIGAELLPFEVQLFRA